MLYTFQHVSICIQTWKQLRKLIICDRWGLCVEIACVVQIILKTEQQ